MRVQKEIGEQSAGAGILGLWVLALPALSNHRRVSGGRTPLGKLTLLLWEVSGTASWRVVQDTKEEALVAILPEDVVGGSI